MLDSLVYLGRTYYQYKTDIDFPRLHINCDSAEEEDLEDTLPYEKPPPPYHSVRNNQTNTWHTLRFDMQKEDLDAFTLDVRLLGDIMHMTPEQTLDKFKDSFDSEISAHLLEANDIESAKAKAQQLIYLYRNKYMPTSASTVLLHEQAEPRTILEHQLAERDTTTQVLNSHTVDDKYTDNDGTIHPETKSRKYSDCDSQNDKYSL